LGPWLVSQHQNEMTEFKCQVEGNQIDEMIGFIESRLKVLPTWYTDLVLSNDLWKMRVSIVMLLHIHSTQQDFVFPIILYHILTLYQGKKVTLYNQEFESNDLLFKALGWILRDGGKSNRSKLMSFLDKYSKYMAKMTISYATEHLTPAQRKKYKK
jgi:3-methyladenine DNA glycosylase AlkD